MAWHENMVLILRTLINDMDTGSPTYEDSRLEQILVVAAHFVNKEVQLTYTYAVDVEAISITPDPVGNDDSGFINLVCLKAACLVLAAETKVLAANSFRIQDASAVIDIKESYTATKALYDKFCADYLQAKMDYVVGNLENIQAIITPTTVESNSTGIIFG
jgi:hypothetical protein